MSEPSKTPRGIPAAGSPAPLLSEPPTRHSSPPSFPPVSFADTLASYPYHIPAMALVLQLLLLLLSRAQGDPGGKPSPPRKVGMGAKKD